MQAGLQPLSNAQFGGSAKNVSARVVSGVLFEVLNAYLIAERDDISYRGLATKLQVAEATVKRLLYHMRQRYRFLRA